MANYATLKSAIQSVIKTNGNNEITGAILQSTLLAVVNSLGANYQLVGVASTSIDPGTPDQNVAYLAGPGTYANFNNLTVNDGYLGLLKYNGSWTLQTVAVGKDYTADLGMIGATIGNFFINTGGIRKDNGNSSISVSNLRFTDFIPINNYGSIKIAGYDGGSSYNYTICAFYDENKTFLSAYPNTRVGFQTVIISASEIPSGAKFIRCTTVDTHTQDCYVLCNLDKYLMDKLADVETLVSTFDSNIQRLLLSQYGVVNSVVATNAASNRIQQYVAGTGVMRFRVTIISGSPTYTSYVVWAGTSGTPLGAQQIKACEFGKIYNVMVPSSYTGITIRTGTSTTAGSVKIEILDNVSDDAQIAKIDQYQTVKTLYHVWRSPGANDRIRMFFPCMGAIRVTVRNVYGTPSGTGYRIYFGTADSTLQRIARGGVLFNSTTDVFVASDSDFTGITIWTETSDASNVTYEIFIEQLDTDEQKLAHRERIVCFGDSITQFNGQNSTGSGANRDGMRYSDYMQILRPGIQLTNVGVGGTRIAQRAAMSLNPTSETVAYAALDIVSLVNAVCSGDFSYQDAATAYINDAGKTAAVARAKTVDLTKVDIVTIFGGTNDWAGDQSLGTIDDTSKTTTLGALNNIISALLTINPRLKIYIILSPVRYRGATFTNAYWCDVYKNANNQTLLELCESLESVAAKNYMPVVDLHRNLGWNEQNFWSFFESPDGTHPIKGFGWIAEKIIKTIFGYN